MGIIKPDQEEEEEEEEWDAKARANAIDETICGMKLQYNINHGKHADVYSRQAGKLTTVNKYKMPILRFIDMSLEKGDLLPNAFVAPHWTTNSRCVMYVVRGEAQVQVANYKGENVMNERAKER